MLQCVSIWDKASTILPECYRYDSKQGYGVYSHGDISFLNIHKNALCMCFFVSWYCQAVSVCNTSKSNQTAVSEVLLAKLVALGVVKNILTFAT